MTAKHKNISYSLKETNLFLDGAPREYVLKVRDLPQEGRPREKLIGSGPSALSLPELLAIILNTGNQNEDVMCMSSRIIREYGEKSIIAEKDPTKLPWKDMDIDVVVESTGLFTSSDKAQAHIVAGAKRVVVTAPIKDEPSSVVKGETVLMGMNEDKLSGCQISSNASCTTNAGSPLLAILDEALGVEKALLNTVHAYTASQAIVDGPSKKDMREGRAAAQNIVPSSTGAAIAVTKVMENLKGLFDGISIRVPVVVGSIVDITFISKKNTTAEEVNEILKKAAGNKRWEGIFTVTEEDLVSSDIKGSSYASIADLAFTRVVGGNLVKVLAWYDNEMGYTHTLVRHVIKAGKLV